MQAVILLGGKGTRLQALYSDRPKALVPIAGRPFLEWQLAWLRKGGVSDFHLAAGHMAEAIERWAAAQTEFKITVSREPAPLGTGGGLKFVEPFLRSDPFLALNGDSLLPNLVFQGLEKISEIFPNLGKIGQNFSKPWKNPAEIFQTLEKTANIFPNLGKPADLPSALAVLAVARIEEAGRYGTVEFDESLRIGAFREKAERQGGWVNGGVYLMWRAALDRIEAGRAVSIETEVFPALAAEGLLAACPSDPPLLDMGTPDGLANMERFLADQAGRYKGFL